MFAHTMSPVNWCSTSRGSLRPGGADAARAVEHGCSSNSTRHTSPWPDFGTGEVERLGAGFGLSGATAYRYLDEALCVLSDRAPSLQDALERVRDEELACLILDGTITTCDQLTGTTVSRKGKEIDLWYSGKAHDFGGNAQALMDPRGMPRWISDVLPGHLNDLNVARELVLAIMFPSVYQGHAGAAARRRHPAPTSARTTGA